MTSEYQLRYQVPGMLGTVWSRQADADTRDKAEVLSTAAASSDKLLDVDLAAKSAQGVSEALVKDVLFSFVDGNFAIVGRSFSDYAHTKVVLGDGSVVHVGYRRQPAIIADPELPSLAQVSRDFRESVANAEIELESNQEWYLIPIPCDLKPIMIETKDGDRALVAGIDFLVYDGFLATNLMPADILPAGMVRIPLAYQKVSKKDSYVLDAPEDRSSSKFLAAYKQKQHSVVAFQRAAAEYAGLYVFETADVILKVKTLRGGAKLYLTASAGMVKVDYPHTELLAGDAVQEGFIVSNFFEVRSKNSNSTDTRKELLQGRGRYVSLNGVLPVNGISWDPTKEVRVLSGATDVVSGSVHSVLNLRGSDQNLFGLSEAQRRQELQSGSFLYDAVGASAFPYDIDLWDVLDGFYDTSLLVAVADSHGDTIDARLTKFLRRFNPTTTTILVDVELGQPEDGYLLDEDGDPALDSRGRLVPIEIDDACYSVYGSEGAILSTGYELWGTGEPCILP